jgi:hypothetical protein
MFIQKIMKKRYIIPLFILVILIVLVARFGYPMLGIITGYTAKNMCSCVFIAGIDEQKVIDEDLNFSALGLADIQVDHENKKVNSSVWGMKQKTAVYRKHLGCALVSNEEQLYRYKGKWPDNRYDSLENWYEIRDTIVSIDESRINKITEVVKNAFLEEEGKEKNTRAVVILHKGKIVGEHYAEGFDKNSRLLGWSMTKSLTSTIFGLMQEDGMVDLDGNPPIEDWKDDDRSKITWKHLLQQSSGLKWAEVYSFVSDATLMLYESDNMGAYAESLPLSDPPGEQWLYSSGTSNIIAYNLADHFSSLGEYQTYPYEKFFHRIGAYSMIMETDASGYFVGSSYSWATARDWARIGQVYLQNGKWEGQQVIPVEWVEFVREPVEASKSEYGGHFYLNAGGKLPDVPLEVFSMNGFQGQRVFIVPSHDLVIVRLGLTYTSGDFDFNRFVSDIIRCFE